MLRAPLILFLGTVLIAGSALMPDSALAAIPDGKIAVIRATAIDGIAKYDGRIKIHRETSMSYDGSNYAFDRGTIDNLEETKAILVIDQRRDEFEGNILVRNHTQEVLTFDDISVVQGCLDGVDFGQVQERLFRGGGDVGSGTRCSIPEDGGGIGE